MRALALALALLLLGGCACALPAGWTALGAAATAVTLDPGHVVQPAVELGGCIAHELQGDPRP